MFVEQHQMQMYVYMQKQITPCGWSNKWESIIRWSWSLEARHMYIYKQNDLQKHPLGNREPVHCTLHIFRNKQIVEPFGYNIGCTNQGWTGIGATRTLAGEHGWSSSNQGHHYEWINAGHMMTDCNCNWPISGTSGWSRTLQGWDQTSILLHPEAQPVGDDDLFIAGRELWLHETFTSLWPRCIGLPRWIQPHFTATYSTSAVVDDTQAEASVVEYKISTSTVGRCCYHHCPTIKEGTSHLFQFINFINAADRLGAKVS